jgi:transposase
VVEGSSLWLNARGFVVRDVVEDGGELVVAIETELDAPVGCAGCGCRARAKDRRRVRLRDQPIGGRPLQIVWHKRVWRCPEPACATNTWTEQRPDLAGARRVLTDRAQRWIWTASRGVVGISV